MTQPATDSKNTINQAFLDTVERRGGYPALKSKIDGTYQPTTYDQLADHVKNFSLGLRELGLNFGDRVAMLAENSQKWAVADLGILSLGAVNVPMFYTSTSKQVSYIVQDSGSKIICVSTKRQLEKVRAFFDQIPELEKIIVFDENTYNGGLSPIVNDMIININFRGKIKYLTLPDKQIFLYDTNRTKLLEKFKLDFYNLHKLVKGF